MAIYKPTLLDKFKDFVNGLKGNWDQYEDHVADFESHQAESSAKHITESGSNDNGYYIKFDDGTMICKHTLTFPGGTPVAGGQVEQEWVYPVAFIKKPQVMRSIEVYTSVTALASNYSVVGRGQITSPTKCNVMVVHLNRTPETAATYVSLVAIGRWK